MANPLEDDQVVLQMTPENLEAVERARQQAEKERRLAASLMHLMPGVQVLGTPDNTAVLEEKGPQMSLRATAFLQRLADLFTKKNAAPYLTFQRLKAEVTDPFGQDGADTVLAHHFYSHSTSGAGVQDLITKCTHLDFPEPYNIERPGGVIEKVIRAFPADFSDFELNSNSTDSEPPSSSPELQADVSHTPASPQIGSEVQ